MKLFVIGGKAKTGKNTLGEMIKSSLLEHGYKPCILHLTSPLYGYAREFFDWDGREESKPRDFLQKMGIEIIQQKLGKKDFLLNRLVEDIEILSEFFDTFIITDARLIHEFQTLKNKYPDVVSIKLERDNYDDYLSDEERHHITETELDQYSDFDYVFQNASLEELKNEVKKMIDKELIDRGENV